jgi:lipopolysaccharide/colanic/teichoic acid biosynthesis glycosyltransferase
MLSSAQKVYLVFKRIIDIFGSIIGILVLSPILLILAIITLCSSTGGIIYKQNRIGQGKKVFKIFKFRSMKRGVNRIPANDLSEDELKHMTTKWGAFMRHTSLDELPQLFNILNGDMSFIGPRPGQTEDVEEDLVQARDSYQPSPYLAKPGLGGYAQVKMHRQHNVQKKAAYDSYYVKHLSFWFDVKIFFISFLSLFGYDSGR